VERLSQILGPIGPQITMNSLQFARALAFGFSLVALTATAQNIVENTDWVELAPSGAPAYTTSGLIPIDMPSYVSTKVGIDPSTISVDVDGVVRYVVVMTNATGNVNTSFEGIRCITDEVKTYGRVNASGQWNLLTDPQWKPVSDNGPSRHAMAIARQGACVARLTTSTSEVKRALQVRKKQPKEEFRF
jgi:hypothetical protein